MQLSVTSPFASLFRFAGLGHVRLPVQAESGTNAVVMQCCLLIYPLLLAYSQLAMDNVHVCWVMQNLRLTNAVICKFIFCFLLWLAGVGQWTYLLGHSESETYKCSCLKIHLLLLAYSQLEMENGHVCWVMQNLRLTNAVV